MKVLVIIYHSVLGIRGSEKNLADFIKKEGFDVIIPDLYEGRTFDDYPSAMQHLGRFAEDGLEKKALALLEEEQKKNGKRPILFMGFSNGSNLAEYLSLKVKEALGTVLFHGGLPVQMFGFEEWPSRLPIQIYYTKQDPWRLEDEAFLQEFLGQIKQSKAKYDFYEYEGKGHLFTDPTLLEEYSEEACRDAYLHIREFLSEFK